MTPGYSERVADMRERLAEFAGMKDGWFDGANGKAPTDATIAWVGDVLARSIGLGLRRPYAYPIDTGGVLAEWGINNWAISARFDPDAKTAFLHAWDGVTDEEREMDWSEAADPDGSALAAFVKGCEPVPPPAPDLTR